MESKDLALKIVKILDSKKAADIQLVEISNMTILADYFVIADGGSSTLVQALANEIEFCLKQDGITPHHVEGFESKTWIILDYGSIIVHIFYKDTREFYGLEKLWSDGTPVDISDHLTEN